MYNIYVLCLLVGTHSQPYGYIWLSPRRRDVYCARNMGNKWVCTLYTLLSRCHLSAEAKITWVLLLLLLLPGIIIYQAFLFIVICISTSRALRSGMSPELESLCTLVLYRRTEIGKLMAFPYGMPI